MRAVEYDAVVVGGGLFGCALARRLAALSESVLLVERATDLMTRASYANQARIHQGYHYPRSLLTGLRSRVNLPRFLAEFEDCVETRFEVYYAIAAVGSNVTAAQFRGFCARIGAPIRPAPRRIKALFEMGLVEDVFAVDEYVFDAARLRSRLRRDLSRAGVEVRLGTEAVRVEKRGQFQTIVYCRHDGVDEAIATRRVLNCTYSEVNRLLRASHLPTISLRYELAEIALVDVPEAIRDIGITVMCGPFFSIMPFPPRELHSLTHVRYTPHYTWTESDRRDPGESAPKTSFPAMQRDATRYMPLLAEARYVDSLWEVKALVPASDVDDSRPILMAQGPEMPRLTTVVGAKIDNVYDALDRLVAEAVPG